jgi:hypothetical protein
VIHGHGWSNAVDHARQAAEQAADRTEENLDHAEQRD